MQAIMTKYIGPSNTKGARIKATWRRYGGHKTAVVISYDDALSQRDNHAMAAMKLCRMVMDGGNDRWNCGETDSGYVFVMSGEMYTYYFGKERGAA